MTELMVLLVLTALVALGWWARRHRQLRAWDRELEVAFAAGERRELSRHRAL